MSNNAIYLTQSKCHYVGYGPWHDNEIVNFIYHVQVNITLSSLYIVRLIEKETQLRLEIIEAGMGHFLSLTGKEPSTSKQHLFSNINFSTKVMAVIQIRVKNIYRHMQHILEYYFTIILCPIMKIIKSNTIKMWLWRL